MVARADLERAAAAALELQRRRREHPLRYARLWDQPLPRTSQRRPVVQFLGGVAHVLVALGGNRTGKTELGAQLTVAHALGGDHPDVEGWCAVNGLDPAAIPKGPGTVCASSLTLGDSLRYGRPKLDRYLPASAAWHNRFGQGEAWVRLPNGGTILCKSNDQGRRSYQGDSWRLAWLDEEHDEPVYDEVVVRLLDQGGRVCLTMTPLLGLTWVWDRWVDDREAATEAHAAVRADSVVTELFMEDNPFLAPADVARFLASVPADQREARLHGGFRDPKGRRFPGFDRHVHVILPRPIPPEWPRWCGVDWGARSPNAVWIAEDKANDLLVVFDELAPRSVADKGEAPIVQEDFLRDLGQHEKRHPGPPRLRIADSEDPSGIVLAARLGVPMIPAPKGAGSIEAGLNAIETRLQLQTPAGVAISPRLVVFSTCASLIRELTEAKWAPSKPGKAPEIDPLSKDHGLDCVRYILAQRAAMGAK